VTSEFELIGRYFARPARNAVLGIGDDCALVAPRPGMQFAVSTDMLLEGRHFVAGTDSEKLGRKALAVNLSDLAACGADPAYALLAVALPQPDDGWVAAFARGFFAMAARYGVELVGGDTTRGPLAICVTVLGEVPCGLALKRSGAAAGEDVWLSGATGEAALAVAHLQKRARLPESDLAACLERLDDPVPRLELGARLRGLATSAIDVSDGLLADLGHIAEASRVAVRVEAQRLPWAKPLEHCQDKALALECIAGGGDDYELAFTASPLRRDELASLAGTLGTTLTRIGTVGAGAGVTLQDGAGQPLAVARRGFDHFG
jgi:thiamine-monophosphate kinase